MEQNSKSVDRPVQTDGEDCSPTVLKDKERFIKNVGSFYNQPEISDVIIKVGEDKYFAHKFVLSTSSEVFRTMLYDKNWTKPESPQQAEIDLEETEECQRCFHFFLKFLYTAQVQICASTVVGILCLADKYDVLSLKSLCNKYMVNNSKSPFLKNALNWYAWSKALHISELTQQCSKTIAWETENLLTSPEWLEMDADFVRDILDNSELVVTNEFTLYLALKLWLNNENNTENFEENGKILLPLIRFPQMHVTELYKVEKCELFKNKDLNPLLSHLINKAYRFRSLCPQQSNPDMEISFIDDQSYTPRNYLDLAVDTVSLHVLHSNARLIGGMLYLPADGTEFFDRVRMQNTLRFGIQVDVRTYVGPVPSHNRDGEWKITYRKTGDNWTVMVYTHESGLINGEAFAQAALIISNQDDKVIEVTESDQFVFTRGNHLTMNVKVNADQAKSMLVLLKPLAK